MPIRKMSEMKARAEAAGVDLSEDAPRSGGGNAQAPGRQQNSGGKKFVSDYLKKMAYGDGGKLGEERSLLAAAANKGEGFPVAAVDYTTKGGKDATYYPVMRGKETLEDVADQVSTNTGLTPEEVLAQLGDPAAAEAAMRTAQHLSASHHAGILNAAQRTATGLGADLIGDDSVRARALEAMAVEAGQLRNAVAPGIGADLVGTDADLRAATLKAMAVEQDALAKALGLSPGNQPGGADAALPEWLPRMDNLTPMQTTGFYGAALAGAGAASVALANHLMAKGQQQSDPVAYAAAMQAMNAY